MASKRDDWGRLWRLVWVWLMKASQALEARVQGGVRCLVAGAGGGELCGRLFEAGFRVTAGKALN